MGRVLMSTLRGANGEEDLRQWRRRLVAGVYARDVRRCRDALERLEAGELVTWGGVDVSEIARRVGEATGELPPRNKPPR